MKADGTTLTLHQSDIKHFLTCPDQFRVVNGILPGGDFDKQEDLRVETDAATVGTVFHAVIEQDITVGFATVSDAERWGKQYMGDLVFDYITDNIEYRTESFGDDPTKSLAALCQLIDRWWRSDRRTRLKNLYGLGHIKLEHSFDVPFITNRTGRYTEVRLAGTIDVVNDHDNMLEDHKSSSSDHNYKRWEKQRWDVQSTVYTYAAAEEKLILPHEHGYLFEFSVYTYKNGSNPLHIPVWRNTGQWGWLTQVVTNMVGMIESDLVAWPLRDDHALCGPKWCPLWSQCKGTFVDEEWT